MMSFDRSSLAHSNLCFFYSTEHKNSDYAFAWHCVFGKQRFDRSKMWKVARAIVRDSLPGHVRIALVLKFAKMKAGSGDGEVDKRPRDAVILYRVMDVAGIISSKYVLRLFVNAKMKAYVYKLDSKHSPPHRLEIIRILVVFIDACIREWSFIVSERCAVLGEKFMSGNIGEYFVCQCSYNENFIKHSFKPLPHRILFSIINRLLDR